MSLHDAKKDKKNHRKESFIDEFINTTPNTVLSDVNCGIQTDFMTS